MLDQLFNTWLTMVDLPALVLLILLCLGGYVLYKTQANPTNNFDFADMLRDDSGKPSGFRLALFVCLGISSWVIMFLVVKAKAIDPIIFIAYIAIWSGAKIAEKFIDMYGSIKGAPPQVKPQPPEQAP